jgi:hypothetical protein
MKLEKEFDCIEMKTQIQELLLREVAELGEEEAQRRRTERLSKDPILGSFLRTKFANGAGPSEGMPAAPVPQRRPGGPWLNRKLVIPATPAGRKPRPASIPAAVPLPCRASAELWRVPPPIPRRRRSPRLSSFGPRCRQSKLRCRPGSRCARRPGLCLAPARRCFGADHFLSALAPFHRAQVRRELVDLAAPEGQRFQTDGKLRPAFDAPASLRFRHHALHVASGGNGDLARHRDRHGGSQIHIVTVLSRARAE